MRKFVISDIHGNGEIYDSIISYLDNISLVEDIELYINGDLIDRGLESYRILWDVINRIRKNNKVKIHYIGGDHELIMYEAIKKKPKGQSIDVWSDWLFEGGGTIDGIIDSSDKADEEYDELKEIIGNLKIYHVFNEKINNKKIILVHAKAPDDLNESLRIKDDRKKVFKYTYTRKKDFWGRKHKLGKDSYFTIIGHTPSIEGFQIDNDDNVLSIDGGCGPYALGNFNYNKVPLVEIKDNSLEILLFNHNNEIINGFTYNGTLNTLPENELNKRRLFIDHFYDNQEEKYKKEINDYIHW